MRTQSAQKFPAEVVRVRVYGNWGYVMKSELDDQSIKFLRLMLKSGWPKNLSDRAARAKITEAINDHR